MRSLPHLRLLVPHVRVVRCYVCCVMQQCFDVCVYVCVCVCVFVCVCVDVLGNTELDTGTPPSE